jgi:UDP:flavonoid glycosyltransferase YjiC (YdhE family)
VRILVAALGSPGHAFPLVPLTVALHDAGHEVTFATGPDVEPTIATAGVPTLAVGRPLFDVFREVMVARGMTGPPTTVQGTREIAGEVFGAAMPRLYAPALRDHLTEHPADLVIAETGAPGAALAAHATGTPCVLHSFGRRPVPVAPFAVRVREPLARVAAEVGIEVAVDAPLGHAYLDVCPPSMQDPETAGTLTGLAELPLRPTGWNPPTPGFVLRRRPGTRWVLLTLGTAFGDAGVLRAAVEGLAAPDLDVLVATGSVDAGELADLDRDGVQVEPFVPQAELLRSDDRPAVVVHHGGSGTTLSCAGAGVPQLFLPQGADQFFNAAAVVATGAGRQLLGPEATPPAVGKAVQELLDDGPERASARALAAEVAAIPSPADVAAEVGAWAQPAM